MKSGATPKMSIFVCRDNLLTVSETVRSGQVSYSLLKEGKMDKHRFFSRLYFVLLTCLLILPCSKDASGAEWIYYGEQDGGLQGYYDKESLIYLPNNSIRVFQKAIPKDEESRVGYLMKLRKADPKIPDNCSYATTLFEINCKNRSYKILEITEYNANDEIVDSTHTENPSTNYLLPDSMVQKLYIAVCVKKDSKKKER